MVYGVYAYRDIKVGFGAPQLQLNEAVAKRRFAQDVAQEGSPLKFMPGDYELYRIGEYNTDSGELKPIYPSVFICSGISVSGGNYND